MCVAFEIEDHHFYLVAQQIGFGITLIISTITIYLVLEHSSIPMKGYKNILLFHLSCFLIHDFVMGVASSGRTFSEVSGFRQMGLLAHIGFPIRYTLLIGGCLTTEVIGIYIDMFVYRTQVILPKNHTFALGEKQQIVVRFGFYMFWISGLIFTTVCFSDDSTDIYNQLKESDICVSDYHYLLFTENAIVVLNSRRWIMLILLVLGVGTTIPSLMMILPSIVLLYSPSLSVNKVCFLFYAQHGNMNSVVLVLAHGDYRRAFVRSVQNVCGNVVNSIYTVNRNGMKMPFLSCKGIISPQNNTSTT
ncbi:unnamed protein product [Auanema sp. JU1783]|nr:unnamed protein product [Auanema sp. JU1783]